MEKSLIRHYERLGWQFIEQNWTNHHNGNDETSYYIKSPRLRGKFMVHKRSGKNHGVILPWGWMTEEQVLRSEAEQYSWELMEDYYPKKQIAAAITEALLKNLKKNEISFTATISIES